MRPDLEQKPFDGDGERPGGRHAGGHAGNSEHEPAVEPGTYTVRLRAGGRTQEKSIVVSEDPRVDLPAADRRAWRAAQREAGELSARAAALAAKLQGSPAANAESRLAIEVRDRLRGLYVDLDDFTGRPTADQMSELAFYRSVVERLER